MQDKVSRERKGAKRISVNDSAGSDHRKDVPGGLSAQSNVALLKKLEDEVNRQSKELRDLKAELMPGKGISPPIEKQKSKALDGHAWNLIDLLSKKQGTCTTNELVEMLGLNKTTVITVMKRAVALDPEHLKMTKGKRRKLHLAYVPG